MSPEFALDFALPPLAAVLLWWLGTGVVIVLDRLPRDTAAFTLAAASLVAAGALLTVGHTADDAGIGAAYAGFVAAVVVWGWHEFAFLGGWLAGPRRVPATPGLAGWPRFAQAAATLLWHELALLATLAVLWAWVGDGANPTAAWTFALLYAMRVSAKLNLFLGVRNLALDFLPPHLAYLGSYFRRRAFNPLMPVALVGGAVVVGLLVMAGADTAGGARAAHLLAASLLTLALVEHAMMVLPLEPSALWRWALKRPAEARP